MLLTIYALEEFLIVHAIQVMCLVLSVILYVILYVARKLV